jgi:hypothetical protein
MGKWRRTAAQAGNHDRSMWYEADCHGFPRTTKLLSTGKWYYREIRAYDLRAATMMLTKKSLFPTTFLLAASGFLGVQRLAWAEQPPPAPRDHSQNPEHVWRTPEWIDAVQTYSMLPLIPDQSKELGASVNGVWAGIGGTDPILPHTEHVPRVRREYGEDAARFARDSHAAGLRVCAAVNGLEGMASLREVVPNLEAMACRKADGQPAVTDDGMTLMCTNNPDWVRWEIARGKKAIDDGADLILVDTPMSSSFVSGFLKAGFCEHCMNHFQERLTSAYSPEERKARFGFADFDRAHVIEQLSPLQKFTSREESPFVKDDAASLLFREFIVAQEEASFATRKALFEELRGYARRKDAEVAFATNAADLGSQNPGGHWIRGIMFADLVDLFAYEQNADPNGGIGSPLVPLPRGKWAAFHKLAYAIHGRRSPAVIHAGNMGQLLKRMMTGGPSINAWMASQTAEAYAANGAYTTYQIGVPIVQKLLRAACWDKAVGVNQFVLDHRDLYEGDLRSGSAVGFLFLYNERGRTIPAVFPSYLGLAQGWVETNHPFDVVFAGDGKYVQDRLSASDLQPYRTIIIPSPVRPTPNQKRVVQDFLSAGGVVVCQEPDELGLQSDEVERSSDPGSWWAVRFSHGKGRVIVLSGEVTATDTTDIGARFFRSYTQDLRAAIGKMATELGSASVMPDRQDGLLAAFPILQPDKKRIIVHLVNYDVDHANDAIRREENVVLTVRCPEFISGAVRATLVHLDGRTIEAPASLENATITVTAPAVDEAAAIVLESAE